MLLNDTRAGWLWLVLRVWLGWQWFKAGQAKSADPDWMDTGVAIRGYWERAVAVPESGRTPIAFDWYRGVIQSLLDAEAHRWFAPVVAWCEVLVGIALILGAFTALAALVGALMNWNFMMADLASSNPMLLMIAIGLIVAWRVSGYVGIDYFLLPRLGSARHILSSIRLGENQ